MKQISRVMLTMLLFSFFSVSGYAESISIEQKLPIEERLKTVSQVDFSTYVNNVEVEEITRTSSNVKMVNRGVPRGSNGNFKTYMLYTGITDKSSKQYSLQSECYTDDNGFRKHGEFYTVAMGTYYAKFVGQKFIVTLDSGVKLPVMIGDFKQDRHTNDTNQYVNLPNKNVVEFIVDYDKMDTLSRKMGDVSYTEGDFLKGSIIKIEEVVEE